MNDDAKSKLPEMRDGKYLSDKRDAIIVRTSVISILANILLAGFKAFIGLLSNSISIILDAVNNLSDALSSIITIIGTHLANKPADKKHPYGYGRVEYLSATVIAAIVLYAGFTSLKESIIKIVHPEKADYSFYSLAIIAVAVVVKLVLGAAVKRTGKKVDSKSLVASGEDARNDALLSASVLLSAIIMKFFGLSLEAYVGVIISIFILRSGVEMLRDTLDDILGTRIDSELSKKVKETICQTEGVYGAYDLFLNDYGPNRLQGSVHVEVDDNMTAEEIDRISSKVSKDVYVRHHVMLTAVGVYSHNGKNDQATQAKESVRKILEGYRDVLQMHGFYLDTEERLIKFDIIISFESPDREGHYNEILLKVQELFPGYTVRINLDADMSD